jgi:hypothetical protein
MLLQQFSLINPDSQKKMGWILCSFAEDTGNLFTEYRDSFAMSSGWSTLLPLKDGEFNFQICAWTNAFV